MVESVCLQEIRAELGEEVVSRIEVSAHDPDDNENLVNVRTTSRGTACWANRRVGEAGFKVGIGTINTHYFAGYGGGPKCVLSGMSGRDAMKHNHVVMREHGTLQGKMEGNAVWEDMLEAGRVVGLDMKSDWLLNSEKQIYKVFVGDVEAEQREAVKGLI